MRIEAKKYKLSCSFAKGLVLPHPHRLMGPLVNCPAVDKIQFVRIFVFDRSTSQQAVHSSPQVDHGIRQHHRRIGASRGTSVPQGRTGWGWAKLDPDGFVCPGDRRPA